MQILKEVPTRVLKLIGTSACGGKSLFIAPFTAALGDPGALYFFYDKDDRHLGSEVLRQIKEEDAKIQFGQSPLSDYLDTELVEAVAAPVVFPSLQAAREFAEQI